MNLTSDRKGIRTAKMNGSSQVKINALMYTSRDISRDTSFERCYFGRCYNPTKLRIQENSDQPTRHEEQKKVLEKSLIYQIFKLKQST